MARVTGKPAWFKLFFHHKAMIDAVPDEAVGKALKAIMAYFDSGELPELDPMTAIVFSALRPSVDDSFEDYERTSRKNRENVKKRWEKSDVPSVPNDTTCTSGNDLIPKHTKHTEGEEEAEEEVEERREDIGASTPSSSPSAKKPVKHKHGEYNNVLLTDEELDKLKAEYPDWNTRIERLSAYVASTGKTYKSHYATIRNWARKDAEKGGVSRGTGNERTTTRIKEEYYL